MEVPALMDEVTTPGAPTEAQIAIADRLSRIFPETIE